MEGLIALYSIELENVNLSFKGKTIFKDLNLKVSKGETIGIIGANGVGKSVLFKLICGLEKANSGKIYVNNIELGKKEDFPRNIGILINEPTFIPIYSGLKNLLLLAEINHNIDENQVREFMLKVGLEPDNKTIVKNYSLGMKKKLAICQAIMENQSILLLDEPFNGLDFSAMSEIRSILETLKEEGKTILLTSHHQTDLDNFCDKLYFIDNQKLIVFTDEMRKKYFS